MESKKSSGNENGDDDEDEEDSLIDQNEANLRKIACICSGSHNPLIQYPPPDLTEKTVLLTQIVSFPLLLRPILRFLEDYTRFLSQYP